MTTIFNIPIEKLHPHARNPRTDLGDLTELAASIKANGVMQNLTVVDDGTGDSYTVIIGHRRLAASKLAELKELPCAIAKMDEQEQIRTMLIENMQRSDLTVYEQAQGFQMMLDFGDTLDTISDRTGFSSATVRRRVKLLELDQKKFQKAESRGATLMDFAALEKVEDAELRNEVLDSAGTSNFKDRLKYALDSESLKKRMAEWEASISEFAEKIDRQGYIGERSFQMDYVRNYGSWTNKRDGAVERPEDADTARYFYRVTEREIDIYREHRDRVKTEEETRLEQVREEAMRKRELFKSIAERHFELRAEFVRDYAGAKKHYCEVARLASAAITCRGSYYHFGLNERSCEITMGIRLNNRTSESQIQEMVNKRAAQNPEHTMMALAYSRLDSPNTSYIDDVYSSKKQAYESLYKKNVVLDVTYEVLTALGYEMSDEEHAMQDGTHELFDNKEEE
jgi:ParB family chromosome partitioning protein